MRSTRSQDGCLPERIRCLRLPVETVTCGCAAPHSTGLRTVAVRFLQHDWRTAMIPRAAQAGVQPVRHEIGGLQRSCLFRIAKRGEQLEPTARPASPHRHTEATAS